MKRGPLVCVTGDLRGKSCQVVPSRGSSIIPRRRAASHPSAAPGKIGPLCLTAEASQTLIQRKPHRCSVTALLQMAVVRHGAALQRSPNNIDHMIGCLLYSSSPFPLSGSSILPFSCPLPNKQLAHNYLFLVYLRFSTRTPKLSISGRVSQVVSTLKSITEIVTQAVWILQDLTLQKSSRILLEWSVKCSCFSLQSL